MSSERGNESVRRSHCPARHGNNAPSIRPTSWIVIQYPATARPVCVQRTGRWLLRTATCAWLPQAGTRVRGGEGRGGEKPPLAQLAAVLPFPT